MVYNPLLDLAFGLFLIIVPVTLLFALVYLTFFQPKTETPKEERPVDLDHWVRLTLKQAHWWKDRLTTQEGDHALASDARGERLEGLIRELEQLENGKSPEMNPDSSPDDGGER